MEEHKCLKCDHKWLPRVKYPRCCPLCKSRKWNTTDIICEFCKRTFLELDEHHIDGNKKNNKFDNLIYLCRDCHSAIHSGFKRTKRRARNYGIWRNYQRKGEADAIYKIDEYRKKLKCKKQ